MKLDHAFYTFLDPVRADTILAINIRTAEKKHQLWRDAAPKQIDVPTPDWSHLKELKQCFQMGPILVL